MAAPAYDLSGVRLKLDRARFHIDAINELCAAFIGREPEPFGFRTEKTPGPDQEVEYRLYALVREQPPRELAPMIGDAIHNIRSALDYLVYELAPPQVRERGRTQFPIFTDEASYRTRGEPMIDRITGDERTLIQRVQPWYASPEAPAKNPLAVLNTLSNRDKHRLLVPVIAAVDLTQVWIGSDNADVNFTRIEPGPVVDGGEIVRFTAKPTNPAKPITIHPQSGLEIALSDTGVEYRGLDDLLGTLHHHVESDLIDMWFKYGWLPD